MDDPGTVDKNLAALATSGLILRQGGLVYLDPGEVASAVLSVLPGDRRAIEAQLAGARADLAVMDTERGRIERLIKWWGHGQGERGL